MAYRISLLVTYPEPRVDLIDRVLGAVADVVRSNWEDRPPTAFPVPRPALDLEALRSIESSVEDRRPQREATQAYAQFQPSPFVDAPATLRLLSLPGWLQAVLTMSEASLAETWPERVYKAAEGAFLKDDRWKRVYHDVRDSWEEEAKRAVDVFYSHFEAVAFALAEAGGGVGPETMEGSPYHALLEGAPAFPSRVPKGTPLYEYGRPWAASGSGSPPL